MHPYTEATEKLRTFFTDTRTLNVVHYACESFYGKTTPTRICAVSVMNVLTGDSSVLSVHKYCLDQNVTITATNSEEYQKAETWLLESFFKYVQEQGTNSRWLHWNMNSETYGFAHLEQRYQQLTGKEPLKISALNRLDLDDALGKIYGQYYMCDMKLLNLIKKNSLSKQHFKTGSEEAFAFMAGDWKLIHDSTHEKISHILAIARLALDHQLKTHIPTWKAHLGGWISSNWQDHPIRTMLALVLTTVGAIASIIQICQQFAGASLK